MSYFPYNAKVCINGNEYARRQAAKAGIGFTPLDNAFAEVDDPAAVQAICEQLTPEKIERLVFKWLARLPYPLTADDDAADYQYEVSVLQAEFSLTQMLDRPLSGRIFFDQLIHDNLDIGRPDRTSLVFDKKSSPAASCPPAAGSAPGCSPPEWCQPAHRLQELRDQAVLQARSGAAHRDHDQQPTRLRHR